jgi:exopolysaccharide biosynthesis predicted pyruvyltransferase EpsI
MNPLCNPILEASAYSHVFARWTGARVRVFWAPGNTGDALIREGAEQLFRRYEVTVTAHGESCDAVFWGGGGNMGRLYRAARAVREKARAFATAQGRPFVVLPQSWTGPDAIVADQFFAREHRSLELCPSAILAPDLALAYRTQEVFTAATHAEGWFFRTDRESRGVPAENIGDPACLAKTAQDYLRLAAQYEVIHTNRLHFAIAAMIAQRQAVLFANSYFKCRAIYDLWLRGRGCAWGELPAG